MSKVEMIAAEIKNLSVTDLTEFRHWFMLFDEDAWDAQIELDAAAGKLNALANEALEEYYSGKAQEI